MTRRAIALVESPLQFLSALETAATDFDGPALTVVAREARGMVAFLDAFGHDWLPRHTRVVRGPARRVDLGRAAGLLLGDPCSGAIQKAVATVPLRHLPPLTILDDGLATVPVMDRLLTSRRHLRRPRQRLSASRMALSAAVSDRIRRHLRQGPPRAGLTWSTALPVPPELEQALVGAGGRLQRHRFEWLRSLPLGRATAAPRIVLGSALVADRLIDGRPYRAWLDAIRADGPIEYHPHRREHSAFLSELAADGDVTIASAALPVELRLVGLPGGTTVHSLPTSALVSLPLLSPDARYFVTPIRKSWWTGRAGDRVRRELNEAVS